MLFLHRGQIRSSEFVTGIKNIVRKQRLVEALTLCEETPGPVPSLVKASLLHFGEKEEKIRYEIQEAALVEIPVLEKRLGTLVALAKSAPLVGLLGTVLGLAQTFYNMEQGGNYSDATVLSNGMWQSLITTACGLAIAVLTYLGFHFLRGRVRALVRDMEWTGNELLKFIVSDLRDEGITPVMEEERSKDV